MELFGDNKELKRIAELLEHLIEVTVRGDQAILAALQPPNIPTAVKISQISGGLVMPITGTNAGGSSTFEADPIPSSIAAFPNGTVDTWTVDDPTVSLSPSGNQVVASVPASNTNASYNLTVSVQMPTPAGGSAPAPLTATVNVPIIAAPPPVPTGVAINQVA